jgi:hypothetical protein
MMTTLLQDIKKSIDGFTRKVRNWTNTLPIFNFEVTVIQRRTTRRLAIEYIERVRNETATKLGREKGAETGRLIGRLAGDLFSKYVGMPLWQKTETLPSTPWVVISPEGEVSVSRSRAFAGIPLDENEFHACLDEIKKHINEDQIDTEAPPDLVAKGYLVEVHRTRLSKLPTFGKASF